LQLVIKKQERWVNTAYIWVRIPTNHRLSW